MNYVYTAILLVAFLLLVAVPEPGGLRGIVLSGMLVAVLVLVPVHLIFAGKAGPEDPRPAVNLSVIGVSGALLTGLFWFRVTMGPVAFEVGFGIEVFKTLFFWVPAVLFGVLYRSAGEGWLPGSRRTVLIRMLVALVASLVGLMAHEAVRGYVETTPLQYGVRHVERQLPDEDSHLDYDLVARTLHLDATLGPDLEESNLRRLQRIRAIAHHAAGLTRRVDTDSVSLRVLQNDIELASLEWPDPETNRPLDRLHIQYSGTDLSDLPTAEDLVELLDLPEPAFRSQNLSVELDGTTLDLTWVGEDMAAGASPSILEEPSRIPDLTHDWRAASRLASQARSMYPGLEIFRFIMPGHQIEVSADTVKPGFSAPRYLPVPERSVMLQIHESDQMPVPAISRAEAPVRIIQGDGTFDTQRRATGPVWPWEAGTLGGFQFHITELRDDGSVTFVMHPMGEAKAARWVTLRPGETKQLFSRYVRSVP